MTHLRRTIPVVGNASGCRQHAGCAREQAAARGADQLCYTGLWT